MGKVKVRPTFSDAVKATMSAARCVYCGRLVKNRQNTNRHGNQELAACPNGRCRGRQKGNP